MKKKLRRFAEETEISAVRSLLKWKYKKEGKSIPPAGKLDRQSREAASLAKEVITKTGKTIWHDLKEVYGGHPSENVSHEKKGGDEKKGGEA